MTPLYLGAVAIGGFLLGRLSKKDKPPQQPGPDLPSLEGAGGVLPDEPPPSHSPDNFGPLWNVTRFAVEIYPADADKTRIPPPTMPDGVTASSDCGVIALGELWWDRAGAYVESILASGERDRQAIYEALLAQFLPQCVNAPTVGATLLRDELFERITLAVSGLPQKSVTMTQVKNPLTVAPMLRSYPYPLFPGTTPKQYGYRNGMFQTQGRAYDYPARNHQEICEQPTACRPCPGPLSFNPAQIYQSAAYSRSSITNYKALAPARNGRAARTVRKR